MYVTGISKEWITYQVIMCTHTHIYFFGFPGGSVVKNPPAMKETQVQSLGQEDPLEKEMATHSSICDFSFITTYSNESYDKPRERIKKQRQNFTDKGPYSQSYGFSSSHV